MQFDEAKIKSLLPKRPKNSHKGTFGHVLNIAGSGLYSGAAYFSSLAPLKIGAGKSTLTSVNFVLKAVSALAPEIILFPVGNSHDDFISAHAKNKIVEKLENYQAITIGCGLGKNKKTAEFFDNFIIELRKKERPQNPILIDADGLNLLAESKKIKADLPANTILTPHPAEMSRLMNVSVENVLENQEFWAIKCSEKFKCTVVLKTHRTVIANAKGHIHTNENGNSALAKGGSGDVLTGIIGGFLAQGLNPFEACVLGTYILGKTAEQASAELSEYSVLATDLLNFIPKAILSILPIEK